MRRRALIISLPLIALFFCVPWPFSEPSDSRLFGLPTWAGYAVITAVLFAALVAVLLGRFWELSAGEGDDDDTTDR